MNQELTLRSNIPKDNEFQVLQTVAKNASLSGLYSGVGSESKIFMILLAAREIGIPPMQALNGGLWNIQGKIEISARLMNAMIRRAGHSIVVKICDDNQCVMEGKRADTGDTFTAQFTIEDAKKAGLVKPNGVWTKYAEDMLYARAMSRLARRLFADIIGTAYVEGEISGEKFVEAKSEVISDIPLEIEEKKEPDLTDEELMAYVDEKAVLFSTTAALFGKYMKVCVKHHECNYKKMKEKFEVDLDELRTKFIKWLAKNQSSS